MSYPKKSEALRRRWAETDPEIRRSIIERFHQGARAHRESGPTLAERLWDMVDGPWIDGIEWDDCWLFKGSWRSKYGYGRIRSGNHQYPKSRSLQAHVAAFELVFGPLAPEDYARHACGERLCCNPFHIAPGAAIDNSRDQWDKDFAWACTPLGEPPRWARAIEE